MKSIAYGIQTKGHVSAEANISAPTSPVLVSIVIAAKDEEKNIGNIIYAVKNGLNGFPYEVIVVDDGSTDRTEEIALSNDAILVSHQKNLGKGAAMKTGVSRSSGEIIVFLDADGDHDPQSIPSLIKPILDGEAEFVIGSRAFSGFGAVTSSFSRRLSNNVASLVISIVISFILLWRSRLKNSKKWTRISDCTSGYRAIRKDSWQKLSLVSQGFQIETEMMYEAAKNQFVFKEFPVSFKLNNHHSHLSIIRDGSLTLIMLIKKLFADIGS
jgi:glycosyltransferase involved in cell wall biosynthesis